MKRPTEYPCTQADIAKLAGVSTGTVSMSLKKDVRIPLATQRLVERAAKQLGYKPDPILSALVSRRYLATGQKALANLALIVDDRWYKEDFTHWIDVVIEGMRNACKHHGYSLEILYLQRDLGQSKHPDKLLQSRGIRGLVILSTMDGRFDMKLDWDQYAVVAFGNQPGSHFFHRVGTDLFASMTMACAKLAELGYRRAGFIDDMTSEIRYRYEWLGSISKECHIRPPRIETIPPYLPDKFDLDVFYAWVRKYQPDCIISNYPTLREHLQRGGWKIPRDIGLALLTQSYDQESTTITHDSARGGRACIDLLHNLLMRGETGHPDTLTETLIYPKWSEGKTTCRQTAKAVKRRAK